MIADPSKIMIDNDTGQVIYSMLIKAQFFRKLSIRPVYKGRGVKPVSKVDVPVEPVVQNRIDGILLISIDIKGKSKTEYNFPGGITYLKVSFQGTREGSFGHHRLGDINGFT